MNKQNGRAVGMRMGAALSMASAIGISQAAPDTPLSEQDFFAEVPIVLSVSRLAQPVSDAPSAVTVIDRDMIRTSGFRELADVFRLVPGFYVGYDSGNAPIVSHGLANSYFGRVQVLVDGRSVYTPSWGQVHWTVLPVALEDVERIEVTRGPNAASYGANSFTGIINIITRHPSQDPGAMISLRSGDPDVKDALARYAGKAGGWDYRVTAGHKEDSGFDVRNDSQHTNYVSVRGDYRLNNADSLQVQGGYIGGTLGVGWFGEDLDGPRERKAASGFSQLRWQRAYAADDELSVQFYHSFHQGREQVLTSRSGAILPTLRRLEDDSQRFDLELQRIQGLSSNLRAVWGASVRHDLVRAPQYLGKTDTQVIKLQRVFGHAEWHPSSAWTINAGAMVEHNDLTGTDTSPRLAANYHFNPQHTIRLGVSKAQRTPTMLEYAANYDEVVNTAGGPVADKQYLSRNRLPPERVTVRELAYLGNFPRIGLALDIRLYHEEIRDIILADNSATRGLSDQYWDFLGGNWINKRGVETQVRWRYGATQLSIAHSFMQTREAGGQAENAERDLKRADPRHLFGGLVSHQFGYGVEGSIGYYYADDMTPFGNSSDFIRAYSRKDVRVAKKFKFGTQRGEIALVTQNVGEPYREFRWDQTKPLQRNDFTRRTLVTLTTEF